MKKSHIEKYGIFLDFIVLTTTLGLAMYYLIGLQNPGSKYTHTRHNVGAHVLTELFPDGWIFDKYLNADTQDLYVFNTDMKLLLPHTFMNKSGQVVGAIKKREKEFNNAHLIVLHDDLDLPFGHIKISYSRGNGGHNGLRSVEQHLGSQKYIRIRIGIAQVHNGQQIKPPVLGSFTRSEINDVNTDISARVGEALHILFTHDLEYTMNHVNSIKS